MKNLIKYLIIIATLGLFACNDKTDQPTTEENADAALELYCKYADNADLTVAYLGDFDICGKSTDAVMIQANNEEDWAMIQLDFGMMPVVEEDTSIVSVSIGIDADFIDEAMFDTLTDISQISEEDLNRYVTIVADKIRNIMDSFQTSDSMRLDDAVVIGQGKVAYDDDSYDEYIMNISRAIVTGLINEQISLNDEETSDVSAGYQEEDIQQQISQNERIMTNAMNQGHNGYITAANHDNRTIWLFFYDNQEECNNILTHIREDIIVTE